MDGVDLEAEDVVTEVTEVEADTTIAEVTIPRDTTIIEDTTTIKDTVKLHDRVIDTWRTRICSQNLSMTARCRVIVMSSDFGSESFFITNYNDWLSKGKSTMLESNFR